LESEASYRMEIPAKKVEDQQDQVEYFSEQSDALREGQVGLPTKLRA